MLKYLTGCVSLLAPSTVLRCVTNALKNQSVFCCRFNSGSPSQHGLFALCALALIEKDLNLAESTLQELCSMITVERGFVDFALLKSAVLMMKVTGLYLYESFPSLLEYV